MKNQGKRLTAWDSDAQKLVGQAKRSASSGINADATAVSGRGKLPESPVLFLGLPKQPGNMPEKSVERGRKKREIAKGQDSTQHVQSKPPCVSQRRSVTLERKLKVLSGFGTIQAESSSYNVESIEK